MTEKLQNEVERLTLLSERRRERVRELEKVVEAAPATILEALNEYGGVEDKDDNPDGFETLLYVAKKALTELDKDKAP